ncbi:hypothetical protein [Demequina aurantiaca]|uniref:hypothetical protein n=1 Tax=Demequina aurantiaca TaxID=676200 RepID=UPI003D358BED
MNHATVVKGLAAMVGVFLLSSCASGGTEIRVTNDCVEDLQFGVYDTRVDWETHDDMEIATGDSRVFSVNGSDVVSVDLVASRVVDSAEAISRVSVSNELTMADLSAESDGTLAITANGDMCPEPLSAG